MPSHAIRLDLDDIIYRLQRFGGASEYWREVTSRLEASGVFDVRRHAGRWFLRALPVFTRAAVFHSSHFRIGTGRHVRNVATVHDMIYELGLSGNSVGARFNLLERRRCYLAADALICVSNSTRDDLLRVYPVLASRPIEVIPHGLSSELTAFARRPRVQSADPADETRPYLLYVGGRQAYKRFSVALEGFSLSAARRDGLALQCTGSAFDADELHLIKRMGLQDCVLSCGNVDRQALYLLYERAKALVYSSTYEGFGLPVIEAMALGCPVIASNTSSIPEVAGDAAILVSPGDPHAIAWGIDNLSTEQTRERVNRGFVHAAQFSWERSAEMHRQVYLEAVQT